MSQETEEFDPIELGRQLHRGRVYLALAAFTFLGLVGLLYLADDAKLDAVDLEEESRQMVRTELLDIFHFRIKVTAPLFVALLVAAAFMVMRRFWWFILLAALAGLAYTGALFLYLVYAYADFQTKLKGQEWFPGQRQVNDFQWLQIGAMGLATFIGFVSAGIVLGILCRPDVEEAFGWRGRVPAPPEQPTTEEPTPEPQPPVVDTASSSAPSEGAP